MRARSVFRSTAMCLLTVFAFGVAVQGAGRSDKAVGEAFGITVSEREFNYYYKTAALFSRTNKQGKSDEMTRQEAWQNLIYRREAAELGITVERGKLNQELDRLILDRLIAGKNVKRGSREYEAWIKKDLGESVEIFESRIEDLLIINSLLKEKGDPEVTVTDEDAEQKYKNQRSSFESEYITFPSAKDAEDFAAKVRENPRLWKDTFDERKPEGQKGGSWINGMSLEALIDLWKIPREDAYRIIGHELGEFIVAKLHYGEAVFRLLKKTIADMSKYDDKQKERLLSTITRNKKSRLSREYFKDLLKRADYRDYVAEERKAVKAKDLEKTSVIVLETNQGNIELKLFPDVAPKTCENFIGLIKKGYYDGIIFHRVIKGFMLQCGDPTGTGRGGESLWGKAFKDEFSKDYTFNKPGILAMANAGPNTNRSQFFITTSTPKHLNGKHTIFGEVISGYDVVEKIENVETGQGDKPKKEQKIIKAYLKGQE